MPNPRGYSTGKTWIAPALQHSWIKPCSMAKRWLQVKRAVLGSKAQEWWYAGYCGSFGPVENCFKTVTSTLLIYVSLSDFLPTQSQQLQGIVVGGTSPMIHHIGGHRFCRSRFGFCSRLLVRTVKRYGSLHAGQLVSGMLPLDKKMISWLTYQYAIVFYSSDSKSLSGPKTIRI